MLVAVAVAARKATDRQTDRQRRRWSGIVRLPAPAARPSLITGRGRHVLWHVLSVVGTCRCLGLSLSGDCHRQGVVTVSVRGLSVSEDCQCQCQGTVSVSVRGLSVSGDCQCQCQGTVSVSVRGLSVSGDCQTQVTAIVRGCQCQVAVFVK